MVSMEDLDNFCNRNNTLNNACHITVDDGENSFYKIVFPILMKHKVPVTLFVSPKIITKRTNYWFQEIDGYDPFELKRSIAAIKSIPYNSLEKYSAIWILKTLKIKEIWEIIKRYQHATHTSNKNCQNITTENLHELDRCGIVTIGAHTMNHPILANEDDITSNFEITASVDELSSLLDHKINYFAYPNGKHDLDFTFREEKILKSNGIRLAVTTEAANISLSSQKMRTPRFCISDGKKLPIIKTKLILGSMSRSLQRIKVAEEVVQRKQLLSDRIKENSLNL
jgi:peptidoglycan/xylan/chitin deacetylase (PgdA/CDA1 family)